MTIFFQNSQIVSYEEAYKFINKYSARISRKKISKFTFQTKNEYTKYNSGRDKNTTTEMVWTHSMNGRANKKCVGMIIRRTKEKRKTHYQLETGSNIPMKERQLKEKD